MAVSTAAPASPRDSAAGHGSSGGHGAAKAAELRSAMNAESREGNEAAANGAYRTAMECFQRLRALLEQERQLLESESDRAVGTDQGAAVKRRLQDNREELAEVTSMISLLRVAVARK
ncbi:MAG: hypothetical protein FJ087_03320 [Deltaproteobacteria bacterium]|nr:hypothetical protein [Deltaproteobacteria bacterium]